MNHSVRVREVIEENDCAGKKQIYITSSESDEIVMCRFIMSRSYALPHDKLHLASVNAEDTVQVLASESSSDFTVVGEYTSILSYTGLRQAMCKCGTRMVSDGFDVYCPHSYCALTQATRIKRLANTQFFELDHRTNVFPDLTNDFVLSACIGEDPNFTMPFHLIDNPMRWGSEFKTVEQALMGKFSSTTLATFLIESEFRDFIDSNYFSITGYSSEYKNVGKFYEDMHDLTTKRNYQSASQNRLAKEFIWSLGIEALTPVYIDALLTYEMCSCIPDSPFVAYGAALTKPVEMVRHMGLHPLEANAIYREVCRRRYEMFDIFAAYSSVEIMSEVFVNMIPELK